MIFSMNKDIVQFLKNHNLLLKGLKDEKYYLLKYYVYAEIKEQKLKYLL